MTYEELSIKSKHKNYTYEDYMCNQPMRDGEEITKFFDEISNTESEEKKNECDNY